MFTKRLINWTDIVQFTSSGVVVLDYPQIREAVTKRFKEIYGSDIDLSTGSADGIYVENYCLMINNIAQGLRQMYGNLDVRTASGIWLDILCALTNTHRKTATASTASIEVTLLDDNSYTLELNQYLSFVDKNGNEWRYTVRNANDIITFRPNETMSIIVKATELGPIRAEAGWIDKTLSTEHSFKVEQKKDAVQGSEQESDSELRARRNETSGSRGASISEGLAGTLIDLDGIDDVRIYDNNVASIAKDNTSLPKNTVYVILRKKENVTLTDRLIGSTIYENMTPGIPTVQTAITADSHSYVYSSVEGIANEQKVWWRQATAITPAISIELTLKENYASKNDSTANLIASNVIDYCNGLRLGEDIDLDELKQVVKNSDPLFMGKSTYSVKTLTIDGKSENYSNPDTYFNYTKFEFLDEAKTKIKIS